MKDGWEYKKFEDALEKVKYTKKLQTTEFLKEGSVPIISQEEDFISGYCDTPEDAFKIDTPVVIFGDHSRVLKYVDFDFVLGADGVKILKPKEDLNAKYLYHYLKWYNVPSMGYSRHYKFLKEIDLPIPPKITQIEIVSELDLLSGVIEKQKAQLEELDKLAQTIFYDMFGGKDWDYQPLKEITLTMGSGATPRGGNQSYKLSGISLIRSLNVHNNSFIYDELAYIDEEQARQLNNVIVESGDVLLNITGASVARCCLVPDNVLPARVNQHVCIIRPMSKVNDVFLCHFLISKDAQIDLLNLSRSNAATREALPKGLLETFLVPLPPLALQQEFASKIEAIESMKAKVRQSLKEAETLFNSRMDYFFN